MKPARFTTPLSTIMRLGIAVPGVLFWATGHAEDVSFNEQIRPILSSRCFACHGPDEEAREAGLRLDLPDGDEGSLNYAIEPGSAEDSELWLRITSDDEDVLMPPPHSHLKPLSPEEQALIRQWIEDGASYEDFWAYQPPTAPAIPAVSTEQWNAQPIDAFVHEKLESNGLKPADEAESRTLIRRLTFDLTGLPPTREEVHHFVAAYQSSPEIAWSEAIDRMLASPRYGEHMARYWLDLVRFADTNGMHKDFYRHQTPYRDWVIRAFNENLPYDDFVKYQLAGDLFDEPTRDQLIASGFNRLHLIIDAGTALPEESQFKNVLDRVTSVGTAFLGLTVQCAQCHDHKFDPITQKDFYSLYSFFDNIEANAETRRGEQDGVQAPFIRLSTPQQEQRIEKFEREIGEMESQKPTRVENLHDSPKPHDAKNSDDIDKALKQWEGALASLRKRRDQFVRDIPHAMVMKEREQVRPTFIRQRGQYDKLGQQVERNTPEFLPPLEKSGEVASRMDLARWLVDRRNPLTARVAVNRFWQQFFGVGLVKTSEDFGSQGDVPSHPRLLDHLTVSFIESGWDVKSVIKQIALSRTYRQSSRAAPEQYRQDPENRLLARGPRYRLDAEMVRDQILATSGLLSDEMFGRSVKPPQPDGLWKAVTMTGERFTPDTGKDIYRRSVYTYWKRGMPPPQMTIFNAPIRDACTARRERTNTPLQALLLLNETQYLGAARQLAMQTLDQPTDQRFQFVWETITAAIPDSKEVASMKSLLEDLRKQYMAHPKLADSICEDLTLPNQYAETELAAWTLLASTLYNLDITKTKN